MPFSSPLTCNELHHLYQELTLLKKQITFLFQEDIAKKDFTSTQQLKKEIQEKILFLQDQFRISIDKARELLTTKEEREQGIINVYGPEEIERAFGVKLTKENIPPIPFTREELKRAGELKEKLILRIPGYTLELLQEVMKQRADTDEMRNTGGIRLIEDSIKLRYFNQDKTKLEWALVSAKSLEHSYSKTAPTQLKLLVDYLEQVVYKDQILPERYQEGVIQFRREYPEMLSNLTGLPLQELDTKTDQEIDDFIFREITNYLQRQELVNWLEHQPIAQQLTHTLVGWFYDFCVRYQNIAIPEQKERLREEYKKKTRLLFHSSSIELIGCGNFHSDGVHLGVCASDNRFSMIGISFSRN